MSAFGVMTSNGVLIGRGMELALNVVVACPICVPFASRARKMTVWLVMSGWETPTQALTRRCPVVKLISIGAVQNSWA